MVLTYLHKYFCIENELRLNLVIALFCRTSRMKSQTIFTFDTKLSADSVEWCPHSGCENLLALGTYQVDKKDNESFDDSQRHGRLYMIKEENGNFVVSL